MQEAGQKNDVSRYRIYEIIVALGTSSAEKLSFAHDAKLIQMLVEEASTNDMVRISGITSDGSRLTMNFPIR